MGSTSHQLEWLPRASRTPSAAGPGPESWRHPSSPKSEPCDRRDCPCVSPPSQSKGELQTSRGTLHPWPGISGSFHQHFQCLLQFLAYVIPWGHFSTAPSRTAGKSSSPSHLEVSAEDTHASAKASFMFEGALWISLWCVWCIVFYSFLRVIHQCFCCWSVLSLASKLTVTKASTSTAAGFCRKLGELPPFLTSFWKIKVFTHFGNGFLVFICLYVEI